MNLLIRLMDFFSSNWTHIILNNGYMMLLFSVILRLQKKRLNTKERERLFPLALLLKRRRVLQAREVRGVLIISSLSSDTYCRWNWRALRWHVCQSNKRFSSTCKHSLSHSLQRYVLIGHDQLEKYICDSITYLLNNMVPMRTRRSTHTYGWRITSNQQTSTDVIE